MIVCFRIADLFEKSFKRMVGPVVLREHAVSLSADKLDGELDVRKSAPRASEACGHKNFLPRLVALERHLPSRVYDMIHDPFRNVGQEASLYRLFNFVGQSCF